MAKNEDNFQPRLDFIRRLLREKLGQEDEVKVVPVQYDPESPFKYNNFVYRATLKAPKEGFLEPRQPGTVAIPAGTKDFIVRLANPDAEGMHPQTRVENEVALISLAAEALRARFPRVVPSIYGWGSAASGQGWILQELMPGEPVDEAFASMDLSQKRHIFSQMAELLKALQDFSLPDSISGFGGVTFAADGSGRIVSTAMSTVGAGPWSSYQQSFEGRLLVALRKADDNPYIRGWHANGIRKRLDAFVRDISRQLQSLESAEEKCIVHADFTTNNLLFDPVTQRITGFIDWDFSSVLHPSYEFLRSFDGAGGQFRGWSGDEEDNEQAALRHAKLNGFPSPLPESTRGEDGGVDWELAKAWEDELERLDVKRPRTIVGIESVADVDTILRSILPWRVSNSDILRLQSEEVIMKCRDENEQHLDGLLQRLGF
ncbi:kinase-like domain-containing protein [Nemania sp. NC0429]|nr:kinase-like domain-containing protein [Nemania sp. NC0429]